MGIMIKKKSKKSKNPSKEAIESKLAAQYKMHEHSEHIYELPDTYIGSIEETEDELWILNNEGKMVREKIKFIPGLYKIVDEIAVNALDQAQRLRIKAQNEVNTTGKSSVFPVKTIKISVNEKENQISV